MEHPVYYDQFTYKLGIQDYGKFLEACGLMIRRHDILRTAYYLGTFAEPLKVVLRSIETPIYLEDISSLSEEDQKATIKSYLERDLRRRLTFEGEVLWHMKVFLLSGTSYYLVWNFHHSILDGWSISQFKIELSQLLASAGTPDVSTLDELKYSYKDYCAIVLGRQASERTREFWKRKLSGFSQNKLPFNYSGKQKSNAIGAKIVQTIVEPETLEALEKLSAKHGVSFKSVCLAAHVFLLHVVSSEEDIVTGVVSHDRQAMEDGDRILGCFLNTVPLRVNIRDAKNNLSLIQNVERLLSETREHEIHLTDIARIIGEKTSMGNPIFDTILNYTDFHVLETWSENKTLSRKLDAVGVTKELKGSEMTNTLFDVEVSKTLGRFTARIKYRSSYFEDQDVKKALDLYVSILQYFASDPQGAISLQPLLSREELQEIVYTFNDTIEPYSDQRGLHELFEEVAEQQPTYTALRVNGRSVSYGDLNQASNKLAWKLIRAGVKPQDNVGLIVRRNEHMIIGMLAILKAGGAYVPVDPEYPVARQSYILENSSVTWVLSDDNYAIQEEYAATFKFMTTNLDVNTSGTEKNPGIKIDPTSLAYTIYTSGSTGKPKGVMIEHRSAVNLVEWVNKTYSVGREDRLLFVTSMCFDLSVYDIFGMLACGGTLVMATKEDVEQLRVLKQLLVEERITFWDSVPTTINYLINELDAEGLPFVQTDLRVVFMSGDWIPVNLPDKIVRFFPNAEVISLGGATEGTVWSNYYPIERGSTHAVSIPYGKPIANNFFYILDSHLNPVPKGVVGELYIGGIGVARGYANNEEKTAYAFMDDPFNKKLGGRMYRTGDLGRMRPDNNMEFIGRRDHQTKIRGYRVELGEIQSLLVKNDSIRDAVVEVFKDHGNNNFLCAYVVLKRETTVDEIKNYLSVSLPGYMIPTYFEFLSALPLNSNGKIDRKLLPAPDQSKLGNADTAQPRNALERKLAGLTAELLGKISVGIHDNFFDLGAHSLNISALANRIHRQLNVELSIRDVFSYPTVEGLAGLIQRKKSSAYEEILPIEEQEYYSATHAQKRFWFLQQKDDNQIAYNMPSAYLVEGYIDQTALEHAMKCLVKRHDSLRTTFMQLNGELVQKVNSFEHSEFSFVYLDLKGNKDNEKTARHWAQKIAKTHFDLERGPLIQTMLLRLEENKFVLLFSLHHIISDGWSKGIFLNELITFYNQQAEGVEATLKPLPLQYKDYAAWQNAKLSDESLERHKSYWMDKFKPLPPPIHLPYDRDRPEVNSYQGKEIGTLFSPELSARINDWGRKNEASLFMVAVTAVNVLLYRITGQHDFVIGTPVAGRDRTGLDRQIGLYLNTVMLRTSFDTNHSFEHLMQQVKENVLSGFEHQVYPFDRLIGDLNLKRDFNKTPLFNVWLVLQNMIDTAEGDTEIHNVKIKRFGNDFNVSRYDLRFTLNETSMGIMVALNYSTDLFEDATAKRILQVFESTVLQMIKNPATIIKDLFSQNNLTTTMQTTENQSLGLVKRNRQAAQSSVPTSLVTESLMASQQLLPHVVTANRKDVDLKQWISDNLDKVKTILLRNGAVLFRNFEVQSIAVFESIVAAYGENMVTYDFASTPRTKLKDKIYTSTEYPADQEILMHNEMAYTNNYPNHLWFFCHLPSQEGGATPLLDSRTVYEKLDPRVKEKFEKEKLMYVRYYHDKLDLSWKKAFQTEHREDVEAYCRKNGISFEWVEPGLLRTSEICEAVVTHPVTNQKVWFNQAHLFHISSVDEGIRNELTDLVGTRYPRNVYFGNGEEISDADLRIIKQSLLQHRIAFPWRQDDVLLVDNMLVAHGRMPYKGDRKIIVAMTK
ncbi:MAG: amino acid adenylation domain-containing protein [Bacteroidota bacterium]